MKKSLLMSVLVVAILLMGAVAYATADTYTTTKTGVGVTTAQTATDTVTAKAFVNAKLILSVTTSGTPQTVDFGNVDPGTAYGPSPVNLTVSSNKLYNVTITTGGSVAQMGLTTTLANSTNNAKTASQAYVDNYSINVPWTTDPGAYTSTVTYTVVQQ
jgi:hypothetical protein